MAATADEFKGLLKNYAAGVTIVTAMGADGTPVGATVSAFSSVSVDPPLILVCLNTSSRTARAVRESGSFTVHILEERQGSLASRFASDAADKFAGLAFATGSNGAPLLSECSNRLECTVFSETEAGTHLIFVGNVERLSVAEAEPLIYAKRQYCGVHAIAAPA